MRNGFTLVELSIVLVIIGLLVGGILVGQSLIDSARTQNLVSYMSQVDIALQQFKSKYRCLPGDCDRGFSPTGDGNGFLLGKSTGGGLGREIFGENREFWKHLSEGGFKPDGVVYGDSYTHASNLVLGVDSPSIDAIDDATVYIAYDPIEGVNTPLFTNNNYEIAGLQTTDVGVISAVNALAFDAKIDDGHPITGFSTIPGETGCASSFGPSPPYALDLENDDKLCRLLIGFDFTVKNYNILHDNQITDLGHTP